MKRKSIRINTSLNIFLVILILVYSCNFSTGKKTKVSIDGTRWLVNEKVINQGSPAEGLLMNVRMVNSIFEDDSYKIKEYDSDFDPDLNTNNFIKRIPEYVDHGVNAFTVCLQGGLPGYEGAINSAFNVDGTLRDSYMNRAARVIKAADANGAVIILSCFYQRQHSHERALAGKDAIKKAVVNVVQWISSNDFTNVVLEISNEYAHGGFRNWTDGDWLRSVDGQVELILLAKEKNPKLLVTTSGMGNGTITAPIEEVADFLLIHYNNTPLANIAEKVNQLKEYNKPIVCNEDDKIGHTGAMAAFLSVKAGAGWGLMHAPINQRAPFEFEGVDDDPDVYDMISLLTQPGSINDIDLPKHFSIVIGKPKDGDIYYIGDPIVMEAFPTGIEKFPGAEIHFLIERNLLGKTTSSPWKITWNDATEGYYNVIAVARDSEGQEIMRSREVDFEVKSK